MRRCVWSRNLKNEEAMARVGPQRHRGKKVHWLFNVINIIGINESQKPNNNRKPIAKDDCGNCLN